MSSFHLFQTAGVVCMLISNTMLKKLNTPVAVLILINNTNYFANKTPAEQRDFFPSQTVLQRHKFEAQEKPMHYENAKFKEKSFDSS